MSLRENTTILNGKYRIARQLGEGGMARVWLAEEVQFGRRQVAIKEPHPDLPAEQEEQAQCRYQLEIRICTALDRASVPNVVRAITVEPYEGRLLLVMPAMLCDLSAVLLRQAKGIPVADAVKVAVQVLRALEGLHDLNIVHRDVKPSNILFDDRGGANLGDFGLAQMSGESGRSTLSGKNHPGTPGYMAPEQAASPEPLTPAADLFALSCVLFEMMTGERCKRVPPGTPPSALRPEVPAWLDAVISRGLERDPWDRWQSTGEMTQALEHQPPPRVGKRETKQSHGASPTPPFDEVWQRIVAHAGEEFRTVSHLPLTYRIDGQLFRCSRTKARIRRWDFEIAYPLVPIRRPSEITNLVVGSAYVWAVLHDPRISQGQW